MDSKYRAHDVTREDRVDGSILLRANGALGPVADRTTDSRCLRAAARARYDDA